MRRVAFALALVSAWAGVARPDDWTVRRDPFDRSVIARYKAILVRTPHDRLALSALVSLYKHHRSVDLLVHEYEASLTEHETAATLVVLGDLVRSRGDNKRALALYTRAVVLAPDDGRSWLAVGTLDRQAGDHKGARSAFEKAVASVTGSGDKKAALTELIAQTTHDGDVIATDNAFHDLIALSPRDGKLWIDRGDALAELHAFDIARDAYHTAEKLLSADPERKLLAISAQGQLLERKGNLDAAIAEYDRAIKSSPAGFYLRRELALRILEIDKKRFPLDDVIDALEKRWPTQGRGAFEWKTLAELYKNARRQDDELRALQAAVRAEPRDTDARWNLIRALERRGQTDEALDALRAAVASNPTDLALGIDLAARLWEQSDEEDYDDFGDLMPMHRDVTGARRILERLSRAFPRDADAHTEIATIYSRMNEPGAAVREQRIATKLDPTEDNLIALGEAELGAGEPVRALEAWKRLVAHPDAASRARFAAVLAGHKFWQQAIDAYTTAMFSDDKNPRLWTGRALAFAAMHHWTNAIADAEHAVEMIGPVPFDDGNEVRGTLVRVLDGAADDDTVDDTELDGAATAVDYEPALPEAVATHVEAWTKAVRAKTPDLRAGYMLAAYFARHPGPSLTRELARLRALAPADLGVLRELIRAKRLERHFDEAIALARELAAKKPEKAAEMKALIASIEADRSTYFDAEAFGNAESGGEYGAVDVEAPPALCRMYHCTIADRWTQRGSPRRVPLVAGGRFGVGVGLVGATERTMTLGTWDAVPVTRTVDAIVRVDATQHVGEMRSVNAMAVALGAGRHALVTPNTALMLSSTLRTELRFGGDVTRGPWDRWGFAADVSLEVTTRALPATFGVRYEQAIADPARTSMLLLELSVGLRCLDLSAGSGACR